MSSPVAAEVTSNLGSSSNDNPQAMDMSCAADQRWVWLGGLEAEVSVEDIKSQLEKFGEIERAHVVASGNKYRARRHAFVLFKDKQEAQTALKQVREGTATLDGLQGKKLRFDWAKTENKGSTAKTPAGAHASKANFPPGFVCICSHKSVQLADPSHFTRDTHDQELHDEMDAHKLKEKGVKVHTMFMPGGGLMAVNPNKNLVMGQRAHRMAVFLGKLHNYAELVEKHGISQIKGGNGKKRYLNVAELLCALYSKMGLEMLGELQGKYAFCMYDPKLVRVLAVRDADGTYPVVESHSEHENLLIACGPYLPAGHREVKELKPSEYKYGWHAPILHYEGQPAATPSNSDETAAKKRKNSRNKKKLPAAAEKAEEHVEAGNDVQQNAGEQGQASGEAAAGGQDEGAPASQATRKPRRRNFRRKPANAAAATDPAAAEDADQKSQERIELPDTLDDAHHSQDQAKPSRRPRRPKQQQQQDQPDQLDQADQQGNDQAVNGVKSNRNRRRRGTGSRRATSELQEGAEQEAPVVAGETETGGNETLETADKPPAGQAAGKKPRKQRRRYGPGQEGRDGSRRASGEQLAGGRRRSSEQAAAQGASHGNNAERVWVPRGQRKKAGAKGLTAQQAEQLQEAESLLGVSSHKISVGQDLDALGTMLAAGLAGGSPRGTGKVHSALVEAAAAMKPSRSCGELTNLYAGASQGPSLVC